MNYQVAVHENESYVETSAAGLASVEDSRLLLKTITSHPAWSPGFSVLVDLRQLKADHLDAADIQSISESFVSCRESLGTGGCAVVTNRDVEYGLARTWQLMTEDKLDLTIRIFRSLPTAERWVRKRRTGDQLK